MKRKNVYAIPAIAFLLSIAMASGCLEGMVKPTAKTDTGLEEQLPAYDGPRARIAVADFDWKVGGSGSTTRITGFGQDIKVSHSYNEYTSGLQDMLTTALVQTKRYRVLERQNLDSLKQEMALSGQGYTDKSGATKGRVKGADIMIMGAVTGWEPGSSGGGGGLGGGLFGKAGAIASAIGGSFKKSSMAMDLRIVDTNTSEVLSATRVEGEAKDVNLGALAGAVTGGGALGGGLSGYAKTPMEKAIRTCIYEAVKHIVANTPKSYMKY